MTLVVAKMIGSVAYVVADTLVSGGKQQLRQPDLALKIFALDENTLVAYAGSPELAHATLVNIARTMFPIDVPNVVEAIQQEQLASLSTIGSYGADFIVLHRSRIIQIKNATVESDKAVAWIGDCAAFSAFQRYQATIQEEDGRYRVIGESLDEQSGASILRRTLERVVADKQIESVGGPVVSASSRKNGSLYCSYMQLHSPLTPSDAPNPDGWMTMDWGTATTGGFGFTTLTPPEKGVSGWGKFYFQAGRGIYFTSDLKMNQFFYAQAPARTADRFCQLLAEKIGYRPQYCGQLGS